jgi:hypothetical protein
MAPKWARSSRDQTPHHHIYAKHQSAFGNVPLDGLDWGTQAITLTGIRDIR